MADAAARLRAVGARRRADRRRAPCARGRRDALRDARLRDAGQARRRLPERLRRGPDASTGGSGRRSTSPTRSHARASSTSSTTTSTGCRSPSPQLAHAPLVTTIHGFSGPAILPAYQRVELGARLDLGRRPRTRARLRRDRPPRRRHRRASVRRQRGRRARRPSAASTPTRAPPRRSRSPRRAGRRLVICGIVQDEAYFPERVEPHIDGDRVRYLGSVGPRGARAGARRAAALLHPIAFAEPFGLSVVESMMCGTPVIAFERGSMPEIVDDGLTGFLVSNAAEAARPWSTRLRHSTAPPAGQSRSSASRRPAWSTTTCASTTRSLRGDDVRDSVRRRPFSSATDEGGCRSVARSSLFVVTELSKKPSAGSLEPEPGGQRQWRTSGLVGRRAACLPRCGCRHVERRDRQQVVGRDDHELERERGAHVRVSRRGDHRAEHPAADSRRSCRRKRTRS